MLTEGRMKANKKSLKSNKKPIAPPPGPNNLIKQRMIHLIEECSELIFILTKSIRFGLDNYHPLDPKNITNKTNIQKEMKDVEKRIEELRKLL